MLAWGGQRHSGGAFLFENRNSILLRYAMQNEASILRFRRPPSPVGFGPSNRILLRFCVSDTGVPAWVGERARRLRTSIKRDVIRRHAVSWIRRRRQTTPPSGDIIPARPAQNRLCAH